jgi:hypothetical protein
MFTGCPLTRDSICPSVTPIAQCTVRCYTPLALHPAVLVCCPSLSPVRCETLTPVVEYMSCCLCPCPFSPATERWIPAIVLGVYEYKGSVLRQYPTRLGERRTLTSGKSCVVRSISRIPACSASYASKRWTPATWVSTRTRRDLRGAPGNKPRGPAFYHIGILGGTLLLHKSRDCC